ncbi:hypothetical protein ABB37_08286 [Leptomonas pyrrhocoris]|uniref:Uncharacterized protein n=1 Tax=Leptomonas pyrrhocoris TaxID=157538 RepID=A0A0M9FTN5_LEPPY|nr:hypothetical protein ABB37_08286 [Leptomonas pyrrhocoris]KPA75747.1 hypothetical protein ABB37_08286 [Leptomonas pyrrhocoris]|eukprot:XP_015654186.1 hypothetical protein ABB37_08286 [Leptomonas pyrrhocoris]
MQRELRRCYMALDDYEVVVAQLRQECTEAWAAHHQLQRQWVQREAELTVQINAARGSERDAEVRKTENGDDRHLAESNCSVEDTDVKACLQTTWRETVDALRRAFHEEKATHTATRRELDAALVAEKRWRTRAAELHRWRNRVCRQLDDSSLVSADTSEKHAAATGVGSTQVSPSHSPFFPGPGNQHPECVHASNGSSPAPRFHSPPHPHQAPSRPHADTAESAYNMADASVLSALTNASAAKDSNGKAAEKSVVNTTTGTVDRSSASSTDASGLSQDDCAGDATAAVGSGRVRVETPEFEPQEEPAEDLIIQMPSQPQLSRSPLHTGPAPHAVTEAARRTQEAGADNEINPSCIASPPTDAGCINDPALAPEGRELAAPLEKATQATKQAQHQEQQRRQLAFPPPTFAMTTDVPGSHKSVCMPWSAKDTSDASRSAVVLAERKCKELLGALLDKERQLALIAEERTKYKRLYVEQTAKQPT